MPATIRAWPLAAALISSASCSFEPAQLAGGSEECPDALTIVSPEENAHIPEVVTLAGKCTTGVPVVVTGDLQKPRSVPCDAGEWSAEAFLSEGDGSKEINAVQTHPACRERATLVVIRSLCTDEVYLADPYSGSGTQEAPHVICNADQLLAMLDPSANLDAWFVLGADVDLTGLPWTPIGDISAPFTGHFDGREHVLSGITAQGNASYVGVFGRLDGADIFALVLARIALQGLDSVGALAGSAINSRINDVIVADVDITGTAATGGLIGLGQGITVQGIHLENVTVTGNVVGGVVGMFEGASVASGISITWVEVSAGSYGGGAFGNTAASLSGVQVSNAIVTCTGPSCGGVVGGMTRSSHGDGLALMGTCFGSPCVTGPQYVGGLAGELEGDLAGSWVDVLLQDAQSAIFGSEGTSLTEKVGGAVGYVKGGTVASTLSNAVVLAPGGYAVGGLIGYGVGPVEACGAKGNVTGGEAVGGLLGVMDGSGVTESFAHGDVHGENGSVGGLIGLHSSTYGVLDSYALGTVTNDQIGNPTEYHVSIGGVVGSLEGGAVERCHYAGTALVGEVSNGPVVGEMISGPGVTLSFWLEGVSQPALYRQNTFGRELMETQMRSIAFFEGEGWSFPPWGMGATHPVCAWQLR